MPQPREIPERIEDRLIVALDVPSVAQARALVAGLDGVVSFFKIGLWLQYAAGFDRLLDDLVKNGKKIFLDTKMFDIGETVKQGVGARGRTRGQFCHGAWRRPHCPRRRRGQKRLRSEGPGRACADQPRR